MTERRRDCPNEQGTRSIVRVSKPAGFVDVECRVDHGTAAAVAIREKASTSTAPR